MHCLVIVLLLWQPGVNNYDNKQDKKRRDLKNTLSGARQLDVLHTTCIWKQQSLMN